MCADRQDNDFVNVLICAAARLCVPSRPLNSFTLNDWVSFVLWLDKVGLLLPLAAIGIDFPYLVAESIAKQKVDLHIAHQKRLNEELFKFSNAAKANRLHFVALKGSASGVSGVVADAASWTGASVILDAGVEKEGLSGELNDLQNESTALNLASDVLSLLSLCVDSVSKGLGTAMSIASFAASKIFKGNADRSCSEGFEYGTSRKGEFAQGMRLLLKVPATYSYTKISIAYYANGESSETESINLNTSFMVRGR